MAVSSLRLSSLVNHDTCSARHYAQSVVAGHRRFCVDPRSRTRTVKKLHRLKSS